MKKILTLIIILLTVCGLIDFIQNKNNTYKYLKSKPPYIIEDKITIHENKRTFILRPIRKNYKDAFEIEVGKFTYDKYKLGDTLSYVNHY